MALIRINRFLADAGFGSRRQVEGLVLSGRVRLNGQPLLELGTKVDPTRDRVEVDGEQAREEKKAQTPIWLYHKPRGCLCTRQDPGGRPTIWKDLDHLPPPYQAVGRLDMDSCGLLLITSRGDLAERLMHPRYEIERVYDVEAMGPWRSGFIERLAQGVEMKEGGLGQAEVLEHRALGSKRHGLRLKLKRGKKREIRYSLLSLGLRVDLLRRISVEHLELGDLKEGSSEPVKEGEAASLLARVGLDS